MIGQRDVSNESMRNNHVGGLWRLNLLTSILSLLPLALLPLLPGDEIEQENLSRNKERSRLGGAVFLTVLFSSLFWSFSSAIYRLIETIDWFGFGFSYKWAILFSAKFLWQFFYDELFSKYTYIDCTFLLMFINNVCDLSFFAPFLIFIKNAN